MVLYGLKAGVTNACFLLYLNIIGTDIPALYDAGTGRPDITIYPENPPDPAYLFGKRRKKFNEMKEYRTWNTRVIFTGRRARRGA